MLKGLKSRRLRRHLGERGGRVIRGHIGYEDITQELIAAGVQVKPYRVRVADFEEYLAKVNYSEDSYYDHGRARYAREKYLEHFVSLCLLAPEKGQVLIDVASMNSPFHEIAADHYGLSAYRQDLDFPEGVESRTIGGDAASMPVPDEFADHLAMHCSFEHFEGDSDIRFIREAGRVLKPGGKLCILPLYTSSEYAIQLHTRGWAKQNVPFERGDRVYVADSWGPPHARFYDAAALVSRVVENLGDLRLTIFSMSNLDEVGSDCYLRYVALFEKPDQSPVG